MGQQFFWRFALLIGAGFASALRSQEPSSTSQSYVGTYQESSLGKDVITLQNGQLFTRLNAQRAIPILVQSDGRFLLKNVKAQIEFLRDNTGNIIGLKIYQNGQNFKFTRISATPELPPPAEIPQAQRPTMAVPQRNAIVLPIDQLKSYCGNYEYKSSDSEVGTLVFDDGHLVWSGRRNGRNIILPESRTRFFIKDTGTEFDFSIETDQSVSALTFHGPAGQEYRYQRLIGTTIQAASTTPGKTYNYSVPTPPTVADLAYASLSPQETLDLYLPNKQPGLAPLVIWIHGGGFSVGDKRSMPRRDFGAAPTQRSAWGPFQIQVPDVTALLAKGYAVVSLNYRTIERTEDSDAIQDAVANAFKDAKAAVRFLRVHAPQYRIDPDKFAVWGNSAGGYMAAILGVTCDQPSIFDDPQMGNPGVSSAIQAAVVWYGAVDALVTRPENRMVHYLLSAKVIPPFLIVNGDKDLNVSVEQARRFHNALKDVGAQSTLVVLPGAKHEAPVFMETQMLPAFTFLDKTFGRSEPSATPEHQ